MNEPTADDRGAERRARRRRRIGLLTPLLLIGGWYAGHAIARGHVDGLIQAHIGEPLAQFDLPDRAGSRWTPQRLRGRPAVLHFFRSRCEACEHEAAAYRSFEQAVGDRATILHVVTDAVLGYPADETAATIARKAFTRPVLIADQAFTEAFHRTAWANVTPVTYVVDADGRIRVALRGAQVLSDLEAALASVR